MSGKTILSEGVYIPSNLQSTVLGVDLPAFLCSISERIYVDSSKLTSNEIVPVLPILPTVFVTHTAELCPDKSKWN
jgi:hypothetical protein